MRKTIRPQNKCGTCGYTWYPKGKDQSHRCPKCQSTSTRIVGPTIGATALAVVVYVVFSMFRGGGSSDPAPAVAPPSPSEQDAALSMESAVGLKASPLLPAALCERPTLTYPRQALLKGQEGTTVVLLRWNEAGEILDVTVQTSSGSPELDRAAITDARRARACPGAAGEGTLALDFSLEGQPGTAEVESPDAAPTQTSGDAGDLSHLPNSTFAYEATLEDFKGQVVLQSKPSMMGDNVAKLAAGSPVRASAREGKWVLIKTYDGKVGYVRGRQLKFAPPRPITSPVRDSRRM